MINGEHTDDRSKWRKAREDNYCSQYTENTVWHTAALDRPSNLIDKHREDRVHVPQWLVEQGFRMLSLNTAAGNNDVSN